jgi:hypothetical protein
MVEPNNAGPSGECLSDIPISGSGSVGGTDAMRCFAWRRSGFEALDVCSGRADTTVVHTTVRASDHACERPHATLSWPTAADRPGALPVISTRRETMAGCDRDGVNVTSSLSGSDVAKRPLRFGSPRLRLQPPPALRLESRRSNPRGCLKPPPTSLEAIGPRCRCAEKRGFRCEPCSTATPTFRGRAFCRGLLRRSRSRVNPRDGLSASSGWLRRPG